MASFFKSMLGGIRNVAASTLYPYKIQIANIETDGKVVEQIGHLTLYRQTGCFEAVFYNKPDLASAYSLFRVTNEGEAISSFRAIGERFVAIYESTPQVYREATLQQVCDCLRDHPLWTAAHVSAYVGLSDAFTNANLKSEIDSRCSNTDITPLMSAISMDQIVCLGEMLKLGANPYMCDGGGNTVFHHAVRYSPLSIPVLSRHCKDLINTINHDKQSPLVLACIMSKCECTELLLDHDALVMVDTWDVSPVHYCMKQGDLKSVEIIITKHPNQLNAKEKLHGGTPLHWARTKEAVLKLLDLGCSPNETSHDHSTPLHVMMSKDRHDCAMTLMCHGVDVNVRGQSGNTHLHVAVMLDDITLVKTMIVFGADVEAVNDKKHSPRHIAAVSKLKNSDEIVFMLHSAGASRCGMYVRGCLAGCLFEGHHNGIPDSTMLHLTALLAKTQSEDILRESMHVLQTASSQHFTKERLLCLDGGGIRGLTLIQMLMAIQTAAKKPIRDCFDWIGGTSKTLPQVLGMYLSMKDRVFVGDRPHPSEPLEELLKKEFGEKTTMADISGPKVIVTSVLADRHPALLHLFRNYESPISRNINADMNTMQPDNYPQPPSMYEQLVWKSARCSGAAPTYFRASDSFLDGGLIANNPTLDVLTEWHEYHTGMKLTNGSYVTPNIGIVVSLGTGRNPTVPGKSVDVFKPSGIMETIETIKGLTALTNLLVDQVTAADTTQVDRARAWCSMINVPYFRLNPNLMSNVPLNCRNDSMVLHMMWETHCYITMNKDTINKIASYL